MNDKKICFIACVNDNDFFSECLQYINRLYVPDGYEIDVISIEEAKSMTGGYNEGMRSSDAKYKIYLHQDTFIVDRFFLQELIDIFTSDPTIGMVGIVGAPKMSEDGCMWNKERVWALYTEFNHDSEKCDCYSKPGTYQCVPVEVIDGLLMATQHDIPWRDDIFTEFDFYDASQSMEFIKKGYKVVVPIMGKPICVHDDGLILGLINYDNNRIKYLTEYGVDRNSQLEIMKTESESNEMEDYKQSKPLVSVLIPTHERPKYFSLALASVVSQTYDNIEIIISDNSMGDETETIVTDFMNKYSNIKYYHTPGLDMHGNWQKCWDNISSEAEYVNFLMDDDIFVPEKIELMVNAFLTNPTAALVTSYRKLIDKDGNLLPDIDFNKPLFNEDTLVQGESGGLKLLVECANWIGEPTTVLFKRGLCDGYFRGWTGKEKYMILDYMLWLRLMEKGSVYYISRPLSFFRQHEANDSKNYATNIEGCISMALSIQTGWNRKVFLKNGKYVRQAILNWILMSSGIIGTCFETNYEGDDFEDLLIVYREMLDKYLSRSIGTLTFDIGE